MRACHFQVQIPADDWVISRKPRCTTYFYDSSTPHSTRDADRAHLLTLLRISFFLVSRVTRPNAISGYVYIPSEPGDSYALSLQADGSVQMDGDLLCASAAVANLHLARNTNYDLAAGFPVYKYPLSLDI